MFFARSDRSAIAKWWWDIDRMLLVAVFTLMGIGIMLLISASPPVAERIGVGPYFFVKKHLIFLPISIAVMIMTSFLSYRQIRLLSFAVFLGSMVLMMATLFVGAEIKGASRWISLFGISLQPSEFMKPAFAVMVAWAFAYGKVKDGFPGVRLSVAMYLATVILLLCQPDVGMTIVVSFIWGVEFFVAGLSLGVVLALMAAGIVMLVVSYVMFAHVRDRVDGFLNPDSSDMYQVNTALEAFRNGRFLGQGPGEGSVKAVIPDVHTDFILTVAAEEFGLVLCLFILFLYAFIVVYSLHRISQTNNLFSILATAGICTQFGMQSLINMASTVHLIPTKGMTLPFISYGGSSLVAVSFAIGILLSLTRKTKEV